PRASGGRGAPDPGEGLRYASSPWEGEEGPLQSDPPEGAFLCPRWESNPHWIGFEPNASACWATGASLPGSGYTRGPGALDGYGVHAYSSVLSQYQPSVPGCS